MPVTPIYALGLWCAIIGAGTFWLSSTDVPWEEFVAWVIVFSISFIVVSAFLEHCIGRCNHRR